MANKERSGSTPEQITVPLQQAWVFSSPAPVSRAWAEPVGRTIEGKRLEDRVQFDDAFQVAVVEDRVYAGSSVDHHVRCLEVRTGKELWRTGTDAPVRLAPTVADGRVYVGSDDGHACCLDAMTGALLWKHRLGPDDERILARGEVISRWPVRTGLFVDRGVVYCGSASSRTNRCIMLVRIQSSADQPHPCQSVPVPVV